MISLYPRYTARMKTVVIVLLIAIVVTLGSGLFYMTGNRHDSAKLQKALRLRVILSGILVLFLVVGYFLGWFNA